MLLLEDKMMGIFDDIDINIEDEIYSDEEGDCPYLYEAIYAYESDIIKKYNGYEKETGATKCVVMPRNCPYVIKMPIKGALSYDYNEETEEDEVTYREYRHSNSDPRWNYCEAEALTYELAEEYGVERFFAKTFYWKMTEGDYPLYLQEKVQTWHCGAPSQRSSVLACNYYEQGIIEDEVWIAFFIDWYGIINLEKLIDFLAEEGINDLCDRNLGYRKNGAPVIFDYSGYNERMGIW